MESFWLNSGNAVSFPHEYGGHELLDSPDRRADSNRFMVDMFGEDNPQGEFGGTSSREAINGGKLSDIAGVRRYAFIDEYSYAGGVLEYRATIADLMYDNYKAFKAQACANDVYLCTGIRLIQEQYLAKYGLGQDFWDNLPVSNPNFQLLPLLVNSHEVDANGRVMYVTDIDGYLKKYYPGQKYPWIYQYPGVVLVFPNGVVQSTSAGGVESAVRAGPTAFEQNILDIFGWGMIGVGVSFLIQGSHDDAAQGPTITITSPLTFREGEPMIISGRVSPVGVFVEFNIGNVFFFAQSPNGAWSASLDALGLTPGSYPIAIRIHQSSVGLGKGPVLASGTVTITAGEGQSANEQATSSAEVTAQSPASSTESTSDNPISDIIGNITDAVSGAIQNVTNFLTGQTTDETTQTSGEGQGTASNTEENATTTSSGGGVLDTIGNFVSGVVSAITDVFNGPLLESEFLKDDADAQAIARGEKTVSLPPSDNYGSVRDFRWKLMNAYRILGYEADGMPFNKTIDETAIKELDSQVAQMENVISAKAAELPFYASVSRNDFKNNLPPNFGAYVLASIYDLVNAGPTKYQTYTPECTWATLYPTNSSNLVGGGRDGADAQKSFGYARPPFTIQQSGLYGFSSQRLFVNGGYPNGGSAISPDTLADNPTASTLTYVDMFIHELTHDMESSTTNNPYIQEAYSRSASCTGSLMNFRQNGTTDDPFSWNSHTTCSVASDVGCKDYVSGYAASNTAEDAAESVDAYIVTPEYFRARAQGSELLMRKYNYIKEIIFGGVEFTNTALANIQLQFSPGSGGITESLTNAHVPRFVLGDIRPFTTSTTTVPPSPTLTLTATPSTINPGQSTTVSWSTANATSCTASGDWFGSQPIGSNKTSVITNIMNSRTLSLTCFGAGGATAKSVIVSVNQTATTSALASVDIKANDSDGPITIPSGQAVLLSWVAQGASDCGIGADQPTSWVGNWGVINSKSSGVITKKVTYTIMCNKLIGSDFLGGDFLRDSVTIDVSDVSAPLMPTLTLTANPSTITLGQSTTLSWSSMNATSCTANGGWSNSSLATNNTSAIQTPLLAGNTTYTISCTGHGGSISKSVTVTVQTAPTPAPTLTFTAVPATITLGQSTTLSWSSTNATSCTANGGWSGLPIQTPSVVGNTTYSISCTGPGGSISKSVTVTVQRALNLSLPDLTAADVALTSATAGTPVSLQSTIRNVGNASTGVGFFALFQKANDSSGAGLSDLGTYVLPVMSTILNSNAIAFSYTFPSSDGDTTKYIRVCADKTLSLDPGVVAESDEDNNCSAWRAVAVADSTTSTPTPTLTFTATPSTITLGQSTTLSWSSTNVASCTADEEWSDSSLATNNTSAIQTPLLVGNTTYSISCTGPGGSISKSVTVTVQRALNLSLPDLTAADVALTSATAGTPVSLQSTIRNVGNASTGVVFFALFQKANDSSGADSEDLGIYVIATLGAGISKTIAFSYTFPSSDGDTTKYIRVCADKTTPIDPGVVAESDEDNNCSAWRAVAVADSTTGTPIAIRSSINQTASVSNIFNNNNGSRKNPSFTYVWKHNLQIGSLYSVDVRALQTALMREGVYVGEVTGGFYNQTFAAVKAFQQKYGIKSIGFVGPQTRAILNVLYGK